MNARVGWGSAALVSVLMLAGCAVAEPGTVGGAPMIDSGIPTLAATASAMGVTPSAPSASPSPTVSTPPSPTASATPTPEVSDSPTPSPTQAPSSGKPSTSPSPGGYISVPIPKTPMPKMPAVLPDNCPQGDFSGSAYDGECGEFKNSKTTPSAAPEDSCPDGDQSGSSHDRSCELDGKPKLDEWKVSDVKCIVVGEGYALVTGRVSGSGTPYKVKVSSAGKSAVDEVVSESAGDFAVMLPVRRCRNYGAEIVGA